MSQRDSGYKRIERDLYETPEWVTEALLPHIPRDLHIWEPAAGSGKIVSVLNRWARVVDSSDIVDRQDFFKINYGCDAIITNPPYECAQGFIERSLKITAWNDGLVAMLLRTDYDHAKTRQHLFSGCRAFAKKLVLTKRIRWIEGSTGQPSFNHAWFIWDWKHNGPPILAYGP